MDVIATLQSVSNTKSQSELLTKPSPKQAAKGGNEPMKLEELQNMVLAMKQKVDLELQPKFGN